MNPMEQLVFDLVPPEPPTFASFLPGRNAEAVAALARFASDEAAEAVVVSLGRAGSREIPSSARDGGGCLERGAAAAYVSEPGALVAMDPESLASRTLVAVDAIETAGSKRSAGSLRSSTRCARPVTASSAPRTVRRRRSRYAKTCGRGSAGASSTRSCSLADEDKPGALSSYARRRGFAVPDDVIRYLLAHARRDMPALLGALAALDRHSLALRRPITVPMLREWLQRDIGLR